MSVLPIRVLGDPVLRQRAEAIGDITDDIRRLADDLFETMHVAQGIGLAAPQVGIAKRLFVADVDDVQVALVNPEIVTADGGMEVSEEGCLSIPELYGDVKRPARVVMKGLDLAGEPVSVDATGLLARCMQHELDHLNGRLFIDYLSFLKKRRALAEWAKREGDFPGHVRVLSPGDPGDPDRRSDHDEM